MCDIDLISPFKITNGYGADPEVIARLLNIPEYTYTFGNAYPGEMENHEFIFYRAKGVIVKDCQIKVDKTGQFWINNLSQASRVYLNKVLVKKTPRVLKIGDSISFGTPQTYDEYQEGPVFRVEKRCIHKSRKRTPNLLQSSNSVDNPTHSSPFKISLIVYQILSYLDFKDLKECRLVCQVWNEEGSKRLSTLGKVTFDFQNTYMRPIQSTQIFRYLNELKTLNMKKLQLLLPSITHPDEEEEEDEAFSDIQHGIDPLDTGTDESNGIFYRSSLSAYSGEPGQKLIDDLKELLASNHNFTCLQLSFRIVHPMSRSLCHFIFSQLGQRLEELELDDKFVISCSTDYPFYIISFPNLKRYKHVVADFTNEINIFQEHRFAPFSAFIDFIVPLLPKTLESFSSSGNIAELYFIQLLRRRDLQLRQISICQARPEGLMKLLRVPLPLTSLELPQMLTISSQRSVSFLERVLQKNRETLKKLVLDLNATVVVIVKFPSFKNLREFSLTYGPNVRIRTNDLSEVVDYSETFPVLRSLEVRPIRRFVELDVNGLNNIHSLPFQWESAEDPFSFFLPSESDQRCLTITSLRIPFLWDEDWMQMEAALYGQTPPAQFAITVRRLTYQFRLQRIVRMFPRVRHKDVKEPKPDFQIYQETTFRRA